MARPALSSSAAISRDRLFATGRLALEALPIGLGKVLGRTGATVARAETQALEEITELSRAPSNALVPKGATPLGKWGEARLAHDLGNQGIKPTSPFSTSLGNRYFDRLVDDIAHEAKAGVKIGLTSQIRTQALKDAEQINSGAISGSHWHFYQGAQPEVLDFLRQNGIQHTVHR